jgi:hypothetical protein
MASPGAADAPSMARPLRFAGAVTVLVSLWMPWYGIHLPADFGSRLGAATGGLPAGLQSFAQGLLAAIPKNFSVTAWQAMSGADVALAMLAGALVLTCLTAVDAQIVGGLGVALLAVVTVHLVSRPFPAEVASLKAGAWVALLGAIVALASAFLSEDRAVVAAAPAAWAAPAAQESSSVAPPR